MIEYFSVSSAVKMINTLSGMRTKFSPNPIQLEAYEPKPTNCILLHCVDRSIDLAAVRKQCSVFGEYRQFEEDNESHCLVQYDATETAKNVFTFLKGFYALSRTQVHVDYASPKCIERFARNRKRRNSRLERSPERRALWEHSYGRSASDRSSATIAKHSNTPNRLRTEDLMQAHQTHSPLSNDSTESWQSPTSTNCVQTEFDEPPIFPDFPSEILNGSLDTISISDLFFASETDECILEKVASDLLINL